MNMCAEAENTLTEFLIAVTDGQVRSIINPGLPDAVDPAYERAMLEPSNPVYDPAYLGDLSDHELERWAARSRAFIREFISKRGLASKKEFAEMEKEFGDGIITDYIPFIPDAGDEPAEYTPGFDDEAEPETCHKCGHAGQFQICPQCGTPRRPWASGATVPPPPKVGPAVDPKTAPKPAKKQTESKKPRSAQEITDARYDKIPAERKRKALDEQDEIKLARKFAEHWNEGDGQRFRSKTADARDFWFWHDRPENNHAAGWIGNAHAQAIP